MCCLYVPPAQRLSRGGDKEPVSSILELYGRVSCCSLPPPTASSIRYLTCEISTIVLERVYSKMADTLQESLRVSSHVVQNLRTIFVYHTLLGLQPVLVAGSTIPGGAGVFKAGEGLDPTKQFG